MNPSNDFVRPKVGEVLRKRSVAQVIAANLSKYILVFLGSGLGLHNGGAIVIHQEATACAMLGNALHACFTSKLFNLW